MKKIILLAFLFFAAGISRGIASQGKVEIGVDEKLGQTLPGDVELYDESGNLTRLNAVLNKPTILVLVYYRCPGVCTPLLTDMTKVVDQMDLVPGKDYQILTVSFDPTETPDLAADKKDTYLGELRKTIDPNGWRFFTGDSANVRRLTDAAGFYYKKDGTNWIHPTSVIAVSPRGEITRYLYGIHQLPLDVKLAVMEASAGRTGPTIAKVMNFCYAYDPEGKHYTFNFVHVAGSLVLGLTAVFMLIFIVIPKWKAKR